MIFADRSRERKAHHLEWRVRLMGAGAIVAVVGMYADRRWMIWVALALLMAGLAVRLLPAGEDERGDADQDGQGDGLST